MHVRGAFVIAFCWIAAVATPAVAESGSTTWPGFRGPAGDGTATSGLAAEVLASPAFEVAWKRALGSGYSGIAVVGGRAFTFYSDGTSDVAAAFDAATGEPQWTTVIGPTYSGHDGSHTGPIATPWVSGGRVFGVGPRGKLFALDARSGKELWTHDLPAELAAIKPHYGFSSSPLEVGGVVILGLGREQGGTIGGFAADTGKLLWSVGGGVVSYQSPMLATLAGKTQVLAATDTTLFGLEPATGAVLWEHTFADEQSSNSTMSPVPAGQDRLFLQHKNEESKLVRIKAEGAGFVVEDVWTSPAIKDTYNVAVYHDGHVYGFSSRFLTCVDAATGKAVWRSRQPGDGFLSLVDGQLLIATKAGTLHLAKASPAGYEETAKLELFADHVWTQPAFAGGRVYARSHGEIAAVALKPKPAAGQTLAAGATTPAVAGERFRGFLAAVAGAQDKAKLVDELLAQAGELPMIEGEDTVHFLYRGEAEDVSLSGDLIGDRLEAPMQRVEGTDLFYYSAKVEPDARLNYRFVKDFEERIRDPRNSRVINDVFGELSWFAMPRWKAPAFFAAAPESRRGRVETVEVASTLFEKPRRLDVYLPAGYDGGSDRYPVAYVHGGKAAQELGELPRALDNVFGLASAPAIVVFIHPVGESGGREIFGDQQAAYLESLAKDVIPFVDGRYRTNAERSARASVGMGFAGFGAYLAAFRHPDTFGSIAGQSVFMMTGHEASLAEAAPQAARHPFTIYLDWGSYDYRATQEAWSIGDANRRLAELLRARGYQPAGGEVHDGFSWASWRSRADLVFATLFPKAGTS